MNKNSYFLTLHPKNVSDVRNVKTTLLEALTRVQITLVFLLY